MRDKTELGIERATVSRLSVIKPIGLIALPYMGTYERACPDLLQIKKEWIDAINKCVVPWDALELAHYMAKERSKDFTKKRTVFQDC